MRILSLDGGGYLGLATAAFLQRVEVHFAATCHASFDLFAGTSTGAIIALALAMGKRTPEIVGLYEQLGTKVFPPPKRGWFRQLLRDSAVAKYDNEGFRECLKDVFGDTTLGDLSTLGKSVLIPAYSLTNGRPRIFKTDHSSNLTKDSGYLLRDIALASAAAPIYLPLVVLADPSTGTPDLLCDGGVYANNPALLAYAEAIHELCYPPSEVNILSVSTPRPELATRATVLGEATSIKKNWGYYGWVRKGKLADIFGNAASVVSDETLRRLIRACGGGKYERIELRNNDKISMDLATPATTQALRSLGEDMASQNTIRDRLRSFFQEGV